VCAQAGKDVIFVFVLRHFLVLASFVLHHLPRNTSTSATEANGLPRTSDKSDQLEVARPDSLRK